MAKRFGPVYEVTHTLDRKIVTDFDVWLSQHAQEMLSIQGICRAETYAADDASDGRLRRVSRYYFDGNAALEDYLAGTAESMRDAALQLFQDNFTVTRRVLRQSKLIDASLPPTEECRNCNATLVGQYCGQCGQRARSRLISIWELLRDAFGDLLEADSRVWRTLIPLITAPGKLTRDYLEGRRARYMPPFRTYLVLSIVFFLVAFFDPSEGFESLSGTELQTPVARDAASEADSDTNESGLSVSLNGNEPDADGDCDDIDAQSWPPWLASWVTAERVKIACERVIADDSRAFISKLLDNTPAALIGLLPVMALILKALYPLSKRYYVEHVLFVVHFHAFVFLVLSLPAVFSLLLSSVGASDYVTPVTTVAVSLYIPVYLFKAMRRVYEQSWLTSLLKYIVLLICYMIGLLAILLITATIAAFTI